jgi:CheY-like chemotaxis protein
VANNGQEGLEFVNNSQFAATGDGNRPALDIVLMDMEMPVMDGCTAARKIRELERSGELLKHVPIMGISANARPEQVALMVEAGMDDAIPKPFRIPTLLARFGHLMERLSINVPPLSPASQHGAEKKRYSLSSNSQFSPEGQRSQEGSREGSVVGSVIGSVVGSVVGSRERSVEGSREGLPQLIPPLSSPETISQDSGQWFLVDCRGRFLGDRVMHFFDNYGPVLWIVFGFCVFWLRFSDTAI